MPYKVFYMAIDVSQKEKHAPTLRRANWYEIKRLKNNISNLKS